MSDEQPKPSMTDDEFEQYFADRLYELHTTGKTTIVTDDLIVEVDYNRPLR